MEPLRLKPKTRNVFMVLFVTMQIKCFDRLRSSGTVFDLKKENCAKVSFGCNFLGIYSPKINQPISGRKMF